MKTNKTIFAVCAYTYDPQQNMPQLLTHCTDGDTIKSAVNKRQFNKINVVKIHRQTDGEQYWHVNHQTNKRRRHQQINCTALHCFRHEWNSHTTKLSHFTLTHRQTVRYYHLPVAAIKEQNMTGHTSVIRTKSVTVPVLQKQTICYVLPYFCSCRHCV